jgi:hypothetical protein
MKDLYYLAENARGRLAREASKGNLNIRKILGHAQLLDTLVAEVSVLDYFQEDHDAQVSARECEIEVEEVEDADLDSESDSSDSDSDWDSDSDMDLELDPETDSASEWYSSDECNQEVPKPYEECHENSDDCVASADDAALDWAEREYWEMANKIAGCC